MVIDNFSNQYLDKCLNIWNEDVGFIFPITLPMFKEKSIECKYFKKECSFVLLNDNEVVGFIIGKVFDNNPNIPKYQNVGWISLLFVKRKYRKQGYGKTLLTKSEEAMKKLGVKSISVGSDIHNFFPGIPNDFDNTSDLFFKSCGYEMGYYTHDLIKELSKVDLEKYDNYNHNEYIDESGNLKKVELSYAKKEDKEDVLAFLQRTFFGRWYDEAIEYYTNGEVIKEYLLARVDDKIVGFFRVNYGLIKETSYNINWRNRFDSLVGFGPLGVDSLYRHHGIAKMLLYRGITDSVKSGYHYAMIDWTGLVTYYQKLGFETWKCYKYAKKTIEL